jgi:hypothetical protein
MLRKGKAACESESLLLKSKGMQAYDNNVYNPEEVVALYWPVPEQRIE